MSVVPRGIPPQIEQQLLALDRQIRDLAFLRGTGRLVLGLCLFLGCGLVLDALLDLNSTLRWGLLVSGMALAGLLLWRGLIRPAFAPVSFSTLAAMIEGQFPELRERLTSLVELRGGDSTDLAPGASRLMQDLLARQTLKSMNQISVDKVTANQSPLLAIVSAAAAVLLLVAPLVWNADGYGLLLGRFFAPSGNFAWGTRLELKVIEGDQVVARGSDVPIHVALFERRGHRELEKSHSTPLWLHWTDANHSADSRRLDWDDQAGKWMTTLPHLQQSLTYRISTGGAKSGTYRIDVADPPVITQLNLEIDPPPYTGLPARNLLGVPSEVLVQEFSRIRLQVTFQDPVVAAQLFWPRPTENQHRDPAAPEEAQGKEHSIPIELATDGKSGSANVIARANGAFAVQARNSLKLTNQDAARQLLVKRDQPPTIRLNGADAPVLVRPDERFEQQVEVTDDFGLAAVELHLETSTGTKQVEHLTAAIRQESPVDHTFIVDLTPFSLSGGQVITYRIRAVDSRPEPAPHEVWSVTRTLMVNTSLKQIPDQQLAAESQSLDEMLNRLRMDLNESKKELTTLHEQIERESLNRTPESNKNDRLNELQNEQTRLIERLEELGDRLGQRPITEDLAAMTEQIVDEQLKVAQERLEQSKNQVSRDQLEPVSQAIDRTGTADRQLQQLERQFNELNKLEQDLGEMSRMAQRAERVAEQLEQIQHEQEQRNLDQESPSPQPLKGDETDAAQRLQNLKDEGKKLADQMQELLKKHPELVDAARREQQQQLSDLAEQARQLAEPQQRLADALKQGADDSPAVASRPENKAPIAETPQSKNSNPNETATANPDGPTNKAEQLESASEQVAARAPDPSQPSEPPQNPDEATTPSSPDRDLATQANAAEIPDSLPKTPAADLTSRPHNTPDRQSEKAESEKPQQKPSPQKPSPQKPSPQKPSQQKQGAEAAREQGQIAEQATEQALKLAREVGADAPATQAAAEFARKAESAKQQAQTGELAAAATAAEAAASAAKETRQQLNPDDQSISPQSQTAEELANRQRESAQRLQKLAQSTDAARGAQQQGQQELMQATKQLANQLDQIAKNLQSEPLNEASSAESGERARQGLEKASESMQQSEQANRQNDPQQSAEGAADAAEKLKQAANEVKPTSPRPASATPVPPKLGKQMADASQQLAAAEKRLQACDCPNPGSGQGPAKPGGRSKGGKSDPQQEGDPQIGEGTPQEPQGTESQKGQPSPQGPEKESQPGQAAAQQGESGSQQKPSPSPRGAASPSGADGTEKPAPQSSSSLAKAAGQFREVAALLRQTRQELKPNSSPGKSSPKSQPGKSTSDESLADESLAESEPGEGEPGKGEAGETPNGTTTPPNLNHLDGELQQQARRNWGRLPGQLRTEILQGAGKKSHPEYTQRIKSYFDEITKPAK
jgi:hypothetical protein